MYSSQDVADATAVSTKIVSIAYYKMIRYKTRRRPTSKRWLAYMNFSWIDTC